MIRSVLAGESRSGWVVEMRRRWMAFSLVAVLVGLAGPSLGAELAATDLKVVSGVAELRGPSARQQLLAIGRLGGTSTDLTRRVEWRTDTPELLTIGNDGVARARGDGTARVVAIAGGQTARLALKVSGTGEPYRPTFERDVMPLLTRAGCNAGACHGKARGQNGFQLSLLGFDPESDYAAITKEARGRRVFPAAPEQSLLLLKPTGQLAHGGGKRLERGDAGYEILRRWIVAGTPRRLDHEPTLERIAVDPAERVLASRAQQSLGVTA